MNDITNLKTKSNNFWNEFIAGIFFICFSVIVLLLLVFKDNPPQFEYFSVLNTTILIITLFMVFMMVRWVPAQKFFLDNKFYLWTIPFFLMEIYTLLTVNWNSELIHVYQTLFVALKNGQNPYGYPPLIYHELSDGSVKLSTFNYLPGEIFLYYFANLIFGQWNFIIMIISNLFLNSIIAIIVYFQFPEMELLPKLSYCLLLIFTSITYSASTVFFIFMLSILVLLRTEDKIDIKNRIFLVFLIGFGSVTKFFMLPFIFVYFWAKIIENKEFTYILDALGSFIIFCVFTLPFGFWNVLNSTILFNLNLGVRAEVTTYYYNVVSGLCYLLNISKFYGPLALILFLLLIILTRNVPFLKRVLIISLFSLILFPTPEDQFLASVFGLLILTKILEIRNLEKTKIE